MLVFFFLIILFHRRERLVKNHLNSKLTQQKETIFTNNNTTKTQYERFCEVTSYRNSKLYGIANVQKSISQWKSKRAYTGKESSVPYRKRSSLELCSINSTNKYDLNQRREEVIEHSKIQLNMLSDQHYQYRDYNTNDSRRNVITKTGLKFCEKPVSFAFAISSQEGSGKIRGFMIADELNKIGHTAVTVFGKEGPLWPDPLRELRTCKKLDVCIFVKWDSHSFPTILKECKLRGARAFIDILDYCDSNRKNIVDQWPHEIDGFILQSEFQIQVFHGLGFPNSVLIRHHHTNSDLEKLNLKKKDEVKLIGFTGSRKNSQGNVQNVLDAIEKWGMKRNIKLVQIVSNRVGSGRTRKTDIYDQLKYHTGAIESIDVAIVWPKDFSNSEIYFKPITRFVHWLSHGIPTIIYPTQSYVEISEEFGYPLIAETTEDIFRWLEVLLSNRDFRNQISLLGLEIAKKFSLRTQVMQYSSNFC